MTARWLVKTEPSTYSFDDLRRDGRTTWDGVKNPVALRNLRAMRVGDEVFVYHTGDEKAVVGRARVVLAANPKHGDADVAVVLEAEEPLPRPVTLAALKAKPALASWELVKAPRLSVMPVPPEAWKAVHDASGLV
jgi:predicted RNA-binding protein with PUA-like domain